MLLLIVIGSLFLLVLVSFGVDALRRRPAKGPLLGAKEPANHHLPLI
jgi:hypothetical protein